MSAHNPACFLAQHGHMEHHDPMPPCEGRLIRAHLIDQQLLRRYGLEPGDPRTYVMACGGLSGLSGHHGLFDSRRLVVPLESLPKLLWEFAEENALTWWLERRYGA